MIAEPMIPAMDHPLSVYWHQPDRSRVLIDDKHAVMSLSDLKILHEYSSSIPTGAYVGKMWKCRVTTEAEQYWQLVWYDEHDDPKLLAIKRRRILVA
jgi:hypothetical protein